MSSSENDKLHKLLTSAGVDPVEATTRVYTYQQDQSAETRLNKSLETLEAIADIQRETEERSYDRLHKARSAGEIGLAETLAPALDDLLREQRAQNEALAKGLTGVLELVKGLRTELTALRDQAPVAAAQKPLVKSLDYIPSPHEEVLSTSRDDLFKALSTASSSQPERAHELLTAAALLESGAQPDEVAQRFNLLQNKDH